MLQSGRISRLIGEGERLTPTRVHGYYRQQRGLMRRIGPVKKPKNPKNRMVEIAKKQCKVTTQRKQGAVLKGPRAPQD